MVLPKRYLPNSDENLLNRPTNNIPARCLARFHMAGDHLSWLCCTTKPSIPSTRK